MNIIPAIDLKNNSCVRLFKGQENKSTIYNSNPPQQALEFEMSGCKKLHLVDLDAAINKSNKNRESIINIRKKVSMRIQLGGGLSSYEQMKFWFENGINDLIVGSMAITNPKLLLRAVKDFPDRIIIAVDEKQNKPMISGWSKEADGSINTIFELYDHKRIKGYVFTDVERDGTLLGLNIKKIKKFTKQTNHKVIVGGGLKDIQDIENIISAKLDNIEGVIIGKSYYDKKISLKDALKVSKNA